jgi:hypothetical protein
LAELRRRQGDLEAARELLEDAREPAERGPYPLFHADALNALARVERDAGRRDAAIAAATAAYRQAWCDGPPFAYHRALEMARMHLADLGAPEPGDMPPSGCEQQWILMANSPESLESPGFRRPGDPSYPGPG